MINRVTWWDINANTWYKHTATVDLDNAYSISVSDIDSDGDNDILGGSISSNTLAWVENINGDGEFGDIHNIDTALQRFMGLDTGDINGDSRPDVAAASQTDEKIVWFENTDGEGAFSPESILEESYTNASTAYIVDIDGDGDNDVLGLAYVNMGNSFIHFWRNGDTNGSGDGTSWTKIEIYNDSTEWFRCIYYADIDNDNDIDIIAKDSQWNNIVWFENTDSVGSAWEKHDIVTSLPGLRAIYPAYINNDNYPDIVFSISNLSSRVCYYLNDGSPLDDPSADNWTEVVVDDVSLKSPGYVLSSDLNNDNLPDIIAVDIVNSDPSVLAFYWWKNLNGSGDFSERYVIANDLAETQTIYSADIDSDGDNDIISAFYNSNEISWWENNLRY